MGRSKKAKCPREAIENAIGIAKNAKVLGAFTCRGQVESMIIDALTNKPEHKAWAIEAATANGHPNRLDIEDAQAFSRDILKMAQRA